MRAFLLAFSERIAMGCLLGWAAVAGAQESPAVSLSPATPTVHQDSTAASASQEGPLLIPAGPVAAPTMTQPTPNQPPTLGQPTVVTPNPLRPAAPAPSGAGSHPPMAGSPGGSSYSPQGTVTSLPGLTSQSRQGTPNDRAYFYRRQRTWPGVNAEVLDQQRTTTSGAGAYNSRQTPMVRLPDGRIVSQSQARAWSSAASSMPRSSTVPGTQGSAAQRGVYQQRPSVYGSASGATAGRTAQAQPKPESGWSNWNPFSKMSETVSSWFWPKPAPAPRPGYAAGTGSGGTVANQQYGYAGSQPARTVSPSYSSGAASGYYYRRPSTPSSQQGGSVAPIR